MKLLICGSREFTSYPLVLKTIREENLNPSEVISGAAKGADSLGILYAEQNGIPIKLFPAEWEKFNRRAGVVRNFQMVDYIKQFPDSAVLAFWDGKSKGTKHCTDYAISQGVRTIIKTY